MDSSTHPLLVPRFKVIADYPKSIHKVGTIYNCGGSAEDLLYCDRDGPRMRDYPHLFESLPWYAERKPEELTGYIKIKSANGEWHIYKGNILDKDWLKWKFGGIRQDEFLPATLEEYNAYLQSQHNH